ncbi:rRNA maturation RNase YbeY [Mariniphaga anaerophila]|uniref:Endoribonuclease YbeY n=1 Tax=Mariniphaga anaerophila TaxID=1484053 RepID=A0A1M5ELH4_9BACT|nr:rRNA maturation RNase YbeY [Mariniphaga anaerophila]SHF79882.1 rRNA maturation RNase YbeY [Mariniphaga anaerophila]
MSKIEFYFEEIEPLKLNRKLIQQAVDFLVENEGKLPGEVSVIFCSDDYLLKINEQYLHHDYYTDIVTFDYVENSVISGDLFISVDRVEDNAGQLGVDFDKELSRVVLHGVLHLVGYKDKTDEEKVVMRGKEDFYLVKAGF